MTRQVISTGSAANDGTGDTLRSAAIKINDNFGELYNAGFNVTINTDNRLMSDVTMSEEVSNVAESFGLGEKDILSITKNTIEAGFVESKLRSGLLEKLAN